MTKRRWWLPAVCLAVLALVAGACGDDDEPTVEAGDDTTEEDAPPEFEAGTTMARLQEAGKITVGTKFDQPLFGLKDPVSGEVEGFDVEIAKLVAQHIFGGSLEEAAEKIEFVETVSANREAFIEEGRVDMVVATYTINDARKQRVDFAGPYYVAGQDIMVKKGDTSIKSVTDLNGKKVCSVLGSTSIKNVQEKAPQADVSTSFDKYSLCAEALADGRVQAVTTDDIILLGLVAERPDDFQVVGETFTTEPYGIGIKKGDDDFRDFLNDVLEEIYESGEWEEAFDRTVGESGEEAPEPPEVDRYTAGATAMTTTTAGVTTTTGG
ncbi:MAG TPA: glutamate ABC transporter substrate-binding protein [Acidimicrobiales bacterium]|nr:glutamate ABC transporter substrate-binding protein [Acidimicrobiales bacterium]